LETHEAIEVVGEISDRDINRRSAWWPEIRRGQDASGEASWQHWDFGERSWAIRASAYTRANASRGSFRSCRCSVRLGRRYDWIGVQGRRLDVHSPDTGSRPGASVSV